MPHFPEHAESGVVSATPQNNVQSPVADPVQPPSDAEQVAFALVEHARIFFHATLAVFCRRGEDDLTLAGYSASTPKLAAAIADGLASHRCRMAPEVPDRLIGVGQPLVLPVTSVPLDLPGFGTSGQVLVVPVQTSSLSGVLLVYGGPETAFRDEEIKLLSGTARFAAVAIANAEHSSRFDLQTQELQQLQATSSELRKLTDFDRVLERLTVHAAEFLRFKAAFVALVEGGVCRLRWISENGTARRFDQVVSESICRHTLTHSQPAWSDDAAEDLGSVRAVRQYLTVPLTDDSGGLIGILGLLDRMDGKPISAEDRCRSVLLAEEVSPVVAAAHTIRLAQQQRRNAEELASMALLLSADGQSLEWVQQFTQRVAELVSARAAVLAISRGSVLEAVGFHDQRGLSRNAADLGRLSAALSVAAGLSSGTREGPAEELLGATVAGTFEWTSVMLIRLDRTDGVPLGVLCLADGRELEPGERNLLQSLSTQASTALQNAHLLARTNDANRHWMEIVDSITDGVVVHDENERVLHINRSLADLIGVRPQQLVGVKMRVLMSMMPEAEHLGVCPFCEHSADGDYLHHVLDRSYLISSSRARALDDGTRTIHVLKDITDRCEAERRYRELFDSLQEGLYFASPDGRFVEVNDTLVRMLGYESREELLQVDIASQLYLEAEHWRKFVEAVERSGAGLRNFEERLRRKDGSAIHMLQNAFALRDAQGRVLQYRGLMLDITDLKNYQVELQRERDFSSKILNNTQSMILVVDTAGLVSYANQRCCEAGHYKENGLLGRRLVDLVAEQRCNQMAHAVEMCLLGQQVDNLELPIMLGDGHTGRFSINLSPMRDEQGGVNSIVVVMTDITDASMLKAKLVHAEKMAAVGQLVSGVAHEVNNPLTAVLGFADLLLENAEVPESAKKEVSVILQEAQRTKQIVQNLLSFARQTPPQRRPMDVNEVLRRTLALRAYDFVNHDIEVVERLDPALERVVGDAHQLQQVFLNIINNAYDALHDIGSKGHIEIETDMNGHFVEIRFRDNGPGVRQPDRIFDPFFTTKEVGKGTGLGLSICYGIVHEHGGEISCENNSGAPGATFTVKLPAGTEAAAAAGGAS